MSLLLSYLFLFVTVLILFSFAVSTSLIPTSSLQPTSVSIPTQLPTLLPTEQPTQSQTPTELQKVLVLDLDGTLYDDDCLIETYIRQNYRIFANSSYNLTVSDCTSLRLKYGSTVRGLSEIYNSKNIFIDYYNNVYPSVNMIKLRKYCIFNNNNYDYNDNDSYNIDDSNHDNTLINSNSNSNDNTNTNANTNAYANTNTNANSNGNSNAIAISDSNRNRNSGNSNKGYEFERMAKAYEILKKIPSDIPIVLASNSPVFHVKRVLTRVGLSKLNITAFITPERRLGITKLEKEFWKPLFELYPRDKFVCTLLDDNYGNVQLVKTLGMNAIQITNKNTFNDALLEFLGMKYNNKFVFDDNNYLLEKNLIDKKSFNTEVLSLLSTKLYQKVLTNNECISSNAASDGDRNSKSNSNSYDIVRMIDLGAGHLNMFDHMVDIIKKNNFNRKKTCLHYIAFESNDKLTSFTINKLKKRFKLVDNSKKINDSDNLFTFEGFVSGMKVIIHLSSTNFMTAEAINLVRYLSNTITTQYNSNNKNIDIILGSCLADLVNPREFSNQIVEMNSDGGSLLYLPITFDGKTKLKYSSKGKSSFFSFFSSTPSELVDEEFSEKLRAVGCKDSNICEGMKQERVFEIYKKHLESSGHHINTAKLVDTFEEHGIQLLAKKPSDWIISRNENDYMFNCMFHFIVQGISYQIYPNYDLEEWINVIKNNPKDIRIVAENYDILAELPQIEKYIHYPFNESDLKPTTFTRLSCMFEETSLEGLRKCPPNQMEDALIARNYTEKAADTPTLIPTYHKLLEFVAPEDVRVVEEAIPMLKVDEVLIQTECSLISSGTELKVYCGDMDNSEAIDLTIPSMQSKMAYPLRYGYSLVGKIIACGEQVNQSEWLGKRVFSFSPHGTHAVSSVSSIIAIPEDVSFDDAAFMPSVETAVSLCMAANPCVGDRVGIVGQGLIGQLTAAVMKVHSPMQDVTIVDINNDRLQQSIDYFSSLDKAYVPATWNPSVSSESGGDFDVFIEVTGKIAGLQTAVDNTKKSGKVVIGSWYDTSNTGGAAIPLRLGTRFHRSGIKMVASQVSSIPAELSDRWTKSRRFDLTWKLLRAVKPSKLLVDGAAKIDMTSSADVINTYDRIKRGEIVTGMLKPL